MAFPPASWDIRHLEDMDKILNLTEGDDLTIIPLLAVKPASGAEGDFRFIIEGAHPISVRVKASDILPASSLSRYFTQTIY